MSNADNTFRVILTTTGIWEDDSPETREVVGTLEGSILRLHGAVGGRDYCCPTLGTNIAFKPRGYVHSGAKIHPEDLARFKRAR